MRKLIIVLMVVLIVGSLCGCSNDNKFPIISGNYVSNYDYKHKWFYNNAVMQLPSNLVGNIVIDDKNMIAKIENISINEDYLDITFHVSNRNHLPFKFDSSLIGINGYMFKAIEKDANGVHGFVRIDSLETKNVVVSVARKDLTLSCISKLGSIQAYFRLRDLNDEKSVLDTPRVVGVDTEFIDDLQEYKIEGTKVYNQGRVIITELGTRLNKVLESNEYITDSFSTYYYIENNTDNVLSFTGYSYSLNDESIDFTWGNGRLSPINIELPPHTKTVTSVDIPIEYIEEHGYTLDDIKIEAGIIKIYNGSNRTSTNVKIDNITFNYF